MASMAQGKNSLWIKGWNVCTSPQPCFLLWGVQQNDWICQTDLMDEHNSQSSNHKRKQAGFVTPWMCWNAKHFEMPLLCKSDLYKGKNLLLYCIRSGHMAGHPLQLSIFQDLQSGAKMMLPSATNDLEVMFDRKQDVSHNASLAFILSSSSSH